MTKEERSAYMKRYREEHREQINASARYRYKKNREKYLACQKAYYERRTAKNSKWISVDERLPEPEVEVLVLTQRSGYSIITTAMYEDGTIQKEFSRWLWVDVPIIYDEENDIEYIPEGWWEYSHYNDDDECGAVSDKVTHWMPLPGPPNMKGEKNG